MKNPELPGREQPSAEKNPGNQEPTMCQNLTHIISDLPNIWEYLQGAWVGFAAKQPPPSSGFSFGYHLYPLRFPWWIRR